MLVSSRLPVAERKSASFAPRASSGAGVAEVARHPVRRFLAERHDAVLAALAAADVHELLLEVDVAEVEPDRLGAAEARGVDELDERAVAQRERALALEGGELPVDLTACGASGSRAAAPRREARVGDAGRAERVAQERADGRQLARDRRRSELAAGPPRAPSDPA